MGVIHKLKVCQYGCRRGEKHYYIPCKVEIPYQNIVTMFDTKHRWKDVTCAECHDLGHLKHGEIVRLRHASASLLQSSPV